MYFRKYWLRKIWLDKCLKSSVSEDPETEKTANGQKHFCNLKGAPLEEILITMKVVALEKVAFSDTQNPKTFS